MFRDKLLRVMRVIGIVIGGLLSIVIVGILFLRLFELQEEWGISTQGMQIILGIGVIVVSLIGIGIRYFVWEEFRSRAQAGELVKRAKAHLAASDWRAAAGLYKEAILKRIDKPSVVESLVDELDSIYRSHGVTVDTGRIRELAKLYKEIWKSKTPIEERTRRALDLVEEMTQYMKSLP